MALSMGEDDPDGIGEKEKAATAALVQPGMLWCTLDSGKLHGRK